MTLNEFSQSCGITAISKSIYCYEKFSEIGHIISADKFPSYGDFRSSLLKKENPNVAAEFMDQVNDLLEDGEVATLVDICNYYDLEIEEFSKKFSFSNGSLQKSTRDADEYLCRVLHTSPVKYEISKKFFQENCRSMLDYLREYNLGYFCGRERVHILWFAESYGPKRAI